MGWISKRHMQTGRSLNPNPGRQRKGPLKRIAYYLAQPEGMFDSVMVRLECGHLARVWSSGQERARCAKCAAGRPVDPMTALEAHRD